MPNIRSNSTYATVFLGVECNDFPAPPRGEESMENLRGAAEAEAALGVRLPEQTGEGLQL